MNSLTIFTLLLSALFTATTTAEGLPASHMFAKRDSALELEDYHLIIGLTVEMWVLVLVGGLWGMWILRKVLRLEERMWSLEGGEMQNTGGVEGV